MTGLLVLGLLVVLAVLAPRFGADSRDGLDWRRSAVPPVEADRTGAPGRRRWAVPGGRPAPAPATPAARPLVSTDLLTAGPGVVRRGAPGTVGGSA